MIRVCPHSDSKCAHGMRCAYTCATDAYDGNKNLCAEQNATAPASPPVAGVDRIGVYEAICDWIRNDVGLGVQMGLTPDATKKLVARIEALASPVSGDGSSSPKSEDTRSAAEGAVLDRGTVEASIYELARLYLGEQAPPAASVSPGMETLQASECTQHGEGEQ